MLATRWSAWRNPATYYTWLGAALLGVTLWVPFLTAERTVRVERRADEIAAHLLAATHGFPVPITPADLPVVLARCLLLAARDGTFVADLEELPEPLPGALLCLANKHYLFQLAVSPTEVPAARRDLLPAYEVVAWPRDANGPGHSVFFHADDALRAYTRNLAAGYAGLDRAPKPGRSHRRPSLRFDATKVYRSYDDERWIAY